jgi:succinate dehydrogenase/fumarate reductase cytochrome b subunit
MDYGKTTVSAAALATVGSSAYGSYLLVGIVLAVVLSMAVGIRLFWRRGKEIGDR